jgi:hypothetical protein
MLTADRDLSGSSRMIPDDPRARRVLSRLTAESRASAWRRGPMSPDDASLHRLYWLVRWVQPRLIHLEGLPAPSVSLILAAAAADSGCRRIRCPLLLNTPDESADSIWSALQDAGLDWLMRSAANPRVSSLLVLAHPPAEQLKHLQQLFFDATGQQAVLGLHDDRAIHPRQRAALEKEWLRLGLQPVLPLSAPMPFWLAMKTGARRPFHPN